MQLDVANAYGCVRRASVLERLKGSPLAFWEPAFRFLYGQPTLLTMGHLQVGMLMACCRVM